MSDYSLLLILFSYILSEIGNIATQVQESKFSSIVWNSLYNGRGQSRFKIKHDCISRKIIHMHKIFFQKRRFRETIDSVESSCDKNKTSKYVLNDGSKSLSCENYTYGQIVYRQNPL